MPSEFTRRKEIARYREITDQPLYDTLRFSRYGTPFPAPNRGQYMLFQVPLGGDGKTLLETNMDNAGMLASPKAFRVQSYGFHIISNNPEDAWAMLSVCHAVFKVMEKDILSAPVDELPSGTGAYGFVTTQLSNGLPTKANVYKFRKPRWLEPNQNFKVELTLTENVSLVGDMVKIRCIFGGLVARAVQ